MIKKNLRLIAVTFLLVAVTAWLVVNKRSGTVRQELRDFAVKDTASITQIFIADRAGHSVRVEREMDSNGKPTGNWILNKKYYARKDAIKTLLETLHSVSVRNMIAKTMYNTVIKELSTTGIKCEVYLNGKDKLEKVIYVGGETQDGKGTFMMLEDSSVPFVTEVPGFDGYLTTRFFTNEQEWRWKNVFNLKPEEISSVTVGYNPDSARSFRIDYRSVNDFSVSSPVSGAKIAKPDTAQVMNYISQFTDVNFEFFDFMMKPAQRDSILRHLPVRTISVTDKKGSVNEVKFYPMQVNQFTVMLNDTTGEPAKYDVDRMYAFMHHDSDLVGVQVFVFGKYFRTLADFDSQRRPAGKTAR